MFHSDWPSKVAAFFIVFALISNDIIASTGAIQSMRHLNNNPSNELGSHYFLPEPILGDEDITTSEVVPQMSSEDEKEDLLPRNEMEIVKSYARQLDFEVLDSTSSLRGYVTIDPDLLPTPNHILNVTRNATHYRLDGEYINPTPIAIGVDVARLGSVADLNRVSVFFLDRPSNTWKIAETIGVEMETFRIKAVVPAETDYFAGMISSPEMPEAAAYVPTSVSDIEPASPATGMRLMQPPTANRQGSAAISYPLWIPQGRNGMTPSLSVNYNSDAGTGWMGLGWNVPQSMISVDTKWGVPEYDTDLETEPYSFNGEALFMQGNKRANRPTLNEAGEVVPLERVTSGSTRFFPRVMASYSEIERRGTSPSNYYWVVTDASQNKSYYGTINGSSLDTNSVLQTSEGNIAQWYLSRTEDKWGNTIDYDYALYSEGSTSNMKNGGINRVLKKITYTGFKGTSYSYGKYTIQFYTSNNRGDGTISLKMGLKNVDDRRLDSISVAFDGTEVVDYRFTYSRSSNTFFKTVLTNLKEYRNDQFFYEHKFNYYEDPLEYSSGEELNTWAPTPWLSGAEATSAFDGLKNAFSRLLQPSSLNTSITSGFSVGADIGAGPALEILATQDKKSTFSAGANWGNHWTNTQRTMRDVNGDGLADVIFEDHDGNFSYFPVYRIGDDLHLGGQHNFEIGGIERSFQKDLSFKIDYLSAGGFYVGMNWRNSTTRIKRSMTDYNGDGIPDMIIDEGLASPRIHFGFLESNGDISFSTSSEHTLNPVIKGVDFEFEDVEDKWEFQIIKTWEAPFSGTINISGTASMAPDLSGSCLVAIQHNDDILNSGFYEVTPTHDYSPSFSLSITKGDILMFRVVADEDGQEDLVSWNPNISYTSTYPQDGNRSSWNSSTSSDGFILSGKEGIQVLGRDSIKLDFNLNMTGSFSDDVFLVVQPYINGVAQTPIKDKLNPSTPSSLPNISTGLSFIGQYGACDDNSPYSPLDTVVFTFSLHSTSNVDWADIECRPVVTYFEDCYLGKKQYPIVDHQTYNNVLVMDGDRNRPTDPSLYYEVLPQLTIDTAAIADIYNGYSQDQDGIVYMTVKSGGGFLSRVAVHFVYKHGNAPANTITLHPINPTTGEIDFNTNLAWNVFNDHSNVKFKGDEVISSMLSVEFFAKGNESENLANYINDHLFRIRFPRSSGTLQTVGGTTPSKNIYFNQYSELNNVHLGWGRFGWHPISEETVLASISTSELHNAILDAVENGNSLPNDSTSMVENGEANSVENQKFAILFPIRGERLWGLRSYQEVLGEGENLDRYSAYGTQISEYRYLGSVSPGFIGEEELETYQTPEPEEGVNPSYTASGALGYSKSSSLSINASAYGVSASTFITDKDIFNSRSTRTFIDLNGDGYPDVLNESDDHITLYPTNSFGSHTTGIQSLALSEETLNKSTSWGAVASYNASSVEADPEGVHEINEDARWGNLTKQSNFSAGVGLNLGRQRTRLAFIDFNGDGLADEYYDDQTTWSGATPDIRLNKGETFESASISTSQTINSSSLSLSPSSAVGTSTLEQTIEKIISDVDQGESIKRRSWNLGANINFVNNHPERTYIDITGDGLVDYLEYNNNYFNKEVNIYINEGGEFHFYGQIDDDPLEEHIGQQNAFGMSVNGTGTGALNIGLVKLKAAITGNGDLSVNGLATSMMDMNGDGTPDYVEDTRSGTIKVYYATFARNGKLQSVENPLGGTFEITYEGEGQKSGYYDPQVKTHLSDENDEKMIWSMPQGKLVMRSVTISDGLDVEISGEDVDGADEFTTRFAYDGGVYSRREREFLGFSRVATIAPSHWEDGVALLEDNCSHDGIEQPRDMTTYYSTPFTPSGDGNTVVETLGRYNMNVVEFSRLTDIDQDEQFSYNYLSKLPETTYKLHVHNWIDSIEVGDYTVPEDIIYHVDKWHHQHIELISESNPDYEIRLVDTDPLSSTLGQVDGEGEDWTVVHNLNSLGECSTIFPAVTEVKKVNFPVVDDRAHYMPSKTSFEYDAYFNIVRVEDEGTGVATSPVEEIVDTMYYTHYVYKEQTNLCSSLSSFDVVYDDGIMYGILIPDLDEEYENAIVYAYHPTNSCYPTGMPELGICIGDETEFISVHRKEITETIYIKEVNYQATYNGNLIALMTYFSPSSSANQTNVLQTHKVYQTNTNSSNLRRFSEVSTLTANDLAPETMKQYLGATTGSSNAESFIHYNTYGLVDSIAGPANHAGEHNWSVITYDPHNLGIAIATENQFGERVNSQYNFGLQQVLQTTDVNGHPMVYRYDDFARLTSIWAPREVYTSSKGPTIQFEYYPSGINPQSGNKNETVPVALTYHNTSNKGESVEITTASTIDDYRSSVFSGGTSTMSTSVHTATFSNRQGQAVQIQTETDYDPAGDGTAKTSILRVSGLGSVNTFGLADIQRKDTLISTSTFGVFRPFKTWTTGTAYYDYATRPVDQQSIWSDFDSGDEYSLVLTETDYEWLGGLSLNNGVYFTAYTSSAGTSSRSYTDSRGRQIATRNGNDILTEFEFDPLSQVVKVKDPVGLETQYTFDNFGRTTQEIHPDRGTTNTTYDEANNITQIDWEGDIINYEYDHTRLKKKLMPSGASDPLYNVEYFYGASDGSNEANAVGRIVKIIQGKTNSPFLVEDYKYDELGHVYSESKSIDIPDVGVKTYLTNFNYDSFGRALRIQYPDNEQVRYQYTDLGSLDGITSQMPSEAVENVISDISYDGYDNVSHILYGNGTENFFTYHDVTRGLMGNKTIAKANSTSGYVNVNERKYFYNDRGLINQVDFYVHPNLITPTSGDFTFNYSYDDVNRLTQTQLIEGGSTTYQLDMSYDDAGSIQTKSSKLIGSNLISNSDIGYNAEYYPVSSTSHQIGEVGSYAEPQLPGQTTPADWGQRFTYNDQGSVEKVEKLDVTSSTYSQDRVMVWNAEQQLIAVSMDNHTNIQHYIYDHTGTRMMKSSYNQSSLAINDTNVGNTSYMEPYQVYVNAYFVESDFVDGLQKTKHYYMGMQRVASDISLNEIQAEEGMNKTSSSGASLNAVRDESLTQEPPVQQNGALEQFKLILLDYGIKEGVDYTEESLFATNQMDVLYPDFASSSSLKSGSTGGDFTCCFNGERYWYHPDYLGSVAMVTNDEGIVHQFFLTNPWGEDMHTYNQPIQGFDSPYRFNGKELDQETGYAYYGARYYDNKLSTWLSVDPLANKYLQVTPYAISNNNPTTFIDPNGKENVIYLVLMSGASSQLTSEDLIAIRNRANTILSNEIGVNTKVVIFQGNGDSFIPSNMDKTDSYALIGTAQDLKEFNDRIPVSKRGLNASIDHNSMSLEMADPAYNYNYSPDNRGVKKGDGMFLSIIDIANFAEASGETINEVVIWSLLHGTSHNAVPTSDLTDLGGHIDGTLLQSGARTAAEVIGGTFFDWDERKTVGGSGEAKLSDIFQDSPDHIIQNYMIQTFGTEEPKANYQSNE